MEPSIGRFVHYVSYGTPNGEYTPQHRSAVITEVGFDGLVGLCVFNPTGLFFRSIKEGGSKQDETLPPAGGTWHWPERV